mmetsp:Transcript_49291/g.157695  ORF Transcript_49291/g.157695 Transcript_49291/m.157695 type:complete len:432 (-) Transcript_49291:382-1677(-)
MARVLGELHGDVALHSNVSVDHRGLVHRPVFHRLLNLLGIPDAGSTLPLLLAHCRPLLPGHLVLPDLDLHLRQGAPEERAEAHLAAVDEREAAVLLLRVAGVPELVARQLHPLLAGGVVVAVAEDLHRLALPQGAHAGRALRRGLLDENDVLGNLKALGVCLDRSEGLGRPLRGQCLARRGVLRPQPLVDVPIQGALDIHSNGRVLDHEAAVVEAQGLARAPELQVRELHPGPAVVARSGLAVAMHDHAPLQHAQLLGVRERVVQDLHVVGADLVEVRMVGDVLEGRHRRLNNLFVATHAFLGLLLRPALGLDARLRRGQWPSEDQALARAAVVDEHEAARGLAAWVGGALQLQRRELSPNGAVGPEHALPADVHHGALAHSSHSRGVLVRGLHDEAQAHHHLELVHLGRLGLDGGLQRHPVHLRGRHLDA